MDGKCMDGLKYTAFLSRAGAFVNIERKREREREREIYIYREREIDR